MLLKYVLYTLFKMTIHLNQFPFKWLNKKLALLLLPENQQGTIYPLLPNARFFKNYDQDKEKKLSKARERV